MPNVIGKIPEFTSDETVSPEETGIEEGKQAAAEEAAEEEKETPSEPPAEEKPAEQEELPGDDTEDLKRQVTGLREEKGKLLKQIIELRGQKREIKKEELLKVEEKLDELKDLHPEDVTTIDRILKAKGYVTKGEANQMFYKAVEQQELDQFLSKYPEYKPENDPNDTNWNTLQREFGYYRLPSDPHLIGEILEKAHRSIPRISGGRNTAIKKKQLETASMGGGGIQRPSSGIKSLDPSKRAMLERGGWSEEEIKDIENNLAE